MGCAGTVGVAEVALRLMPELPMESEGCKLLASARELRAEELGSAATAGASTGMGSGTALLHAAAAFFASDPHSSNRPCMRERSNTTRDRSRSKVSASAGTLEWFGPWEFDGDCEEVDEDERERMRRKTGSSILLATSVLSALKAFAKATFPTTASINGPGSSDRLDGAWGDDDEVAVVLIGRAMAMARATADVSRSATASARSRKASARAVMRALQDDVAASTRSRRAAASTRSKGRRGCGCRGGAVKLLGSILSVGKPRYSVSVYSQCDQRASKQQVASWQALPK
ncbi:hypothetical protein DFJ73DRAFT_847438 [Zopfochytrium polystomum]|nr:hypothetical protein DFJ73DRAFT_847438 [Zopfochytrium polystomum]